MHSTHVHQWDYDTTIDALQAEPTQTVTIRKRYAQRLRGRLDEIRTVSREAIAQRDIFGLESSRTTLAVTPPDDFEFETRSDKVTGFRTWLDNQLSSEVLEPYGRGGNQFIREGYEMGIEEADGKLGRLKTIDVGDQKVEAALRRPVHKESLQTIYTRNFRQLEGLTSSMGSDISRVLSDGLAAGKNPHAMAGDVAEVIGRGGAGGTTGAEARATMIARTEVQNAHHMASMNRYEEFGVEKANIVLAGGACSTCQDLASRNPWPLDELRSIQPSHPHCRCSSVPVSPS